MVNDCDHTIRPSCLVTFQTWSAKRRGQTLRVCAVNTKAHFPLRERRVNLCSHLLVLSFFCICQFLISVRSESGAKNEACARVQPTRVTIFRLLNHRGFWARWHPARLTNGIHGAIEFSHACTPKNIQQAQESMAQRWDPFSRPAFSSTNEKCSVKLNTQRVRSFRRVYPMGINISQPIKISKNATNYIANHMLYKSVSQPIIKASMHTTLT